MSPKIYRLMEHIRENDGKHLVFTNFVQKGINIIAAALEKEGWQSFTKTGKTGPKTFAIWDGSVKDNEKQLIKSRVNSIKNINGEYIRVIIGSPSIREGISLKHIQHMHLVDPLWNQSAKTQVEGRAIRFCSHIDFRDESKRVVNVYKYKLMPRDDGVSFRNI